MKLINSVDNGTFISISQKYVLFSKVIDNKSIIDLYNRDLNPIYSFEFDTISIPYMYENSFYFKYKDGLYFKFNPFDKTIKEYIKSDTQFIESRINNLWAFSSLRNFDKNNTKITPALKQIYKEGKLIEEIKEFGSIKFINNDYFFLVTSIFSDPSESTLNTFSFFKLYAKDAIWHFNLEDNLHRLDSTNPFNHPHKVRKPLGIYQDQLWFDIDNYGLMCLNKNTGEFMHYLRDCPENDKRYGGMPRGNFPVIPFTDEAVLLDDEGKIVCLAYWYYWELDLNTLKLDFHYLRDYFQEVGCYTFGSRFKPLIVEGNLVYIVSTQTHKFAAFNRQSLKYEWIEELPEGSGQPKSIEKHGDRIYIETFDRKLLVYEV